MPANALSVLVEQTNDLRAGKRSESLLCAPHCVTKIKGVAFCIMKVVLAVSVLVDSNRHDVSGCLAVQALGAD